MVLMSFLCNCVSVLSPGLIFWDAHTQELEAVNSLVCYPVDENRYTNPHLSILKIKNRLLDPADVESKIVFLAPFSQIIDLPSVRTHHYLLFIQQRHCWWIWRWRWSHVWLYSHGYRESGAEDWAHHLEVLLFWWSARQSVVASLYWLVCPWESWRSSCLGEEFSETQFPEFDNFWKRWWC